MFCIKSRETDPGGAGARSLPKAPQFATLLSARQATKGNMQIGLMHYTSWPTVGGVEVMLRQQAGLMAKAGHEVSVICGSGLQFSPNIKTVVLEVLNISSPSVTAAQAEILNGFPGPGYFALVQKLRDQLTRLLQGMDCVIAHNLMTMPFHLAATQVLTELAEIGRASCRERVC